MNSAWKKDYLQNEYRPVDTLAEHDGFKTMLVYRASDQRMYVWKEVAAPSAELYEKLRGIHHPGLAEVYEVAKMDGYAVVIESYMGGESLEKLTESEGGLSEERARGIMLQLLDILYILEENDIVHRDISPKNVLVTESGQAALIDFGIARQTDLTKTKDTTILGTAGYAAPEQFGFAQTDSRSDLYALGVLYHWMLTGRLPSGHISDRLLDADFIRQCISIDPSNRYETIAAARAAVNLPRIRRYRQWLPLGFRSDALWKKVIAFLIYGYLALTCATLLMLSAQKPKAFVLSVCAQLCYVVGALAVGTNYGDWTRRLWPFKKVPRAVTVVIQIVLVLLLVYYGGLLQYTAMSMVYPNP